MKVQTGLQVDKFVFDGFKEVCKGERIMVGEAVQRLMEACLKAQPATLVLRGCLETEIAKLFETTRTQSLNFRENV